MADGDGWRQVGKGGRLRAPRDPGGGVARGERGGERGAGVGAGEARGDAGGRGGAQGQGAGARHVPQHPRAYQQGRERPKAPNIRAKVKPRPFTVLLDCKAFQELPTEEEVAEWFGDHLFQEGTAELLGKVAGLDIEERDKRILVQLTSQEEVELLLNRMGPEGVEWPKFLDPVTNQPVKIKGISTDNSSLKVTLLDVPRDVSDQTIRVTMERYGRVEEVKKHHLAKEGMEHISVNRVTVRIRKEEDVELPANIFALGSSTSGSEISIWRVTYPGAPRRCFRCGFTNHLARNCTRQPITLRQVEKLPVVGEPEP